MAAVLAAVLFSVAAVALADTRMIKDKRGDTRGCQPRCNDLRSVTAGHRGGYLYYKFVYYSLVRPIVELNIKTPKRPECGFEVAANRYVDGKEIDAVFEECDPSPRVGRLIVGRPNSKTITFKFSSKAIGRPRSYRWRAISNGDFAPNGRRGRIVFVEHRLR